MSSSTPVPVIHDIVIIGAGPAGLTAAYELSHELDSLIYKHLHDGEWAEKNKEWEKITDWRNLLINSHFTSDEEEKYSQPSKLKGSEPLSIVVLEARNRVGGRVNSITFEDGAVVEEGAAFIQGKYRHTHSFYYMSISSR